MNPNTIIVEIAKHLETSAKETEAAALKLIELQKIVNQPVLVVDNIVDNTEEK
jgi:hypothetical protein